MRGRAGGGLASAGSGGEEDLEREEEEGEQEEDQEKEGQEEEEDGLNELLRAHEHNGQESEESEESESESEEESEEELGRRSRSGTEESEEGQRAPWQSRSALPRARSQPPPPLPHGPKKGAQAAYPRRAGLAPALKRTRAQVSHELAEAVQLLKKWRASLREARAAPPPPRSLHATLSVEQSDAGLKLLSVRSLYTISNTTRIPIILRLLPVAGDAGPRGGSGSGSAAAGPQYLAAAEARSTALASAMHRCETARLKVRLAAQEAASRAARAAAESRAAASAAAARSRLSSRSFSHAPPPPPPPRTQRPAAQYPATFPCPAGTLQLVD